MLECWIGSVNQILLDPDPRFGANFFVEGQVNLKCFELGFDSFGLGSGWPDFSKVLNIFKWKKAIYLNVNKCICVHFYKENT